MRTATIQSGRVIDVEEVGESAEPRSDGLTRIPCPGWVELGWTWDGERFVSPAGVRDSDEAVATWKRRYCFPRAFNNMLPEGSRRAILAAALQSPDILGLLFDLSDSLYLESDNPELLAGIAAIEAAGILPPGGGKALLSGPAWTSIKPNID